MHGWKCSPEWTGEQCFIICGGASVLKQNLKLLQGRRVIVVNSSYEAFPEADFLIFGDSRWFTHHQKKVETFKGRIVSVSSVARHSRLLRLNRKRPPGFSKEPNAATIQFTTLTCALNLAIHLGVKKIVLLGADGKATDGKTHHHSPHPWKQLNGCWDKQKKDLVWAAAELKQIGIECVNASPGSAWADLWPIVNLEDCLDYVAPGELEPTAAIAGLPAIDEIGRRVDAGCDHSGAG